MKQEDEVVNVLWEYMLRKMRKRYKHQRARQTLFSLLRLIRDEIQRGRDPSSLVRRVEGMIDVLADAGIITDATAERCADWLARVNHKGDENEVAGNRN